MGSWEGYIPNIMNNGAAQKAAIFGQDGSQWAASAGFSVSADEVKAILGVLNGTGAVGKVSISGEKYMVLRVLDNGDGCNVMYCKLKDHGGFCVAKTKQGVVFGGYEEGGQAGTCNASVERVADYLKGTGY